MSRKRWKPRLGDMVEATTNILSFTSLTTSLDQFQNDKKTFDACIRNFQILGEASKHIPTSVQKAHPEVPWDKIRGMRNILVHEYFGTSPGIVWKTIKDDLPKLQRDLQRIVSAFEKTSHPLKICPLGEYFVHGSDVDAHFRAGVSVRRHPRAEHCREYANEMVNILNQAEAEEIAREGFEKSYASIKLANFDFGKEGSKYDLLIYGWVTFWNEVLAPQEPLDANLFKALIASESSFNPNVGNGSRGGAKGLSQLMPLTIKALQGYRNELKDHFVIIEGKDVFDPNLNISAGVRWLFQKRVTASKRLKRQATWIEAVEDYKDVLRRRLKSPKAEQKAIKRFNELLKMIEKEK